MLNNRFSFLFNKLKNSKLVENFIYLTSLQFLNYLLPILTLPYLIKVLQPENYGLTVYAQTVMLYFFVFIDYGFNLTATRNISINKEDRKKINEIFNNVITTKLLLLFISLFILAILVFSVPKFSNNWILYLFTSGILIGQVFFPLWLFQGLQEMKYLLYFNLLSRIIFTVLVFIVIQSSNDFIYVNLLSSLGSILVGILSIFLVIRKYKIRFQIATKANIIIELKEGWMVFLSNFSIQMYIGSNIIILGFFANDKTIGNYSVAEKITFILRQFLGAFSQAIYPHLCQLATTPKLIKPFFKRTLLPFLGIVFLICLALFIFAGKIVILLVGKENPEIVTLIRILCFVPFIVGMNIPAYQTLLAFNYKNAYSKIMISGALLNIVLNLTLAYFLKSYGTAISVFITEIFITFGLIIMLKIKLKANSDLLK
ncbi:MAG: flippase [Bacteroidetes bacterium]|nr:flippase [Bacteroidota bacterium]